MKKIFTIAIAFSFLFVWGCGKDQVKKDEPKPKPKPVVKAEPKVDPVKVFVEKSNEKLEKIPVAGFKYKKAKVSKKKWKKWAKDSAPVVQGMIDKLPEGYVLQVTGHADASGPEEPVGKKPGNIKISEKRAKTIYKALKKNGVKSKKLTYKGVGSAFPKEDLDPRDPKQRRVTFEVVPAEGKEEAKKDEKKED